jgi:acyl-CoA thioesterase FadM
MDDDFPASFSQTFRIRYDECGAGGALRAAVHLRLLQEIAFGHSAAVGFPLAWYEAERQFWVARRVRLVVHARVAYGEAITYTTRIAGARKVMARRFNTAVRAADGAQVATCLTDWILTREGVATARIPEAVLAAFPGMAEPVTPQPLVEPDPPAQVSRVSRQVRAGDLDAMRHVNHTVFLDLLDDAVIREGGQAAVESYPRTYNLRYGAAAQVGEPLCDVAWQKDDRWFYRLERPREIVAIFHGQLSRGTPEPCRRTES